MLPNSVAEWSGWQFVPSTPVFARIGIGSVAASKSIAVPIALLSACLGLLKMPFEAEAGR